MDFIRQYILGILAAAVICGIINSFFKSKGSYGTIIKLLTGLFMTITLISPVIKLELSDMVSYLEGLSLEADGAVEYGRQVAGESAAAIIKSQTEAYILDKAAFWELNLKVEVTLSESDPPVPESVVLKGSASPYVKSQLSKYIADDLGISEEQQKWI